MSDGMAWRRDRERRQSAKIIGHKSNWWQSTMAPLCQVNYRSANGWKPDGQSSTAAKPVVCTRVQPSLTHGSFKCHFFTQRYAALAGRTWCNCATRLGRRIRLQALTSRPQLTGRPETGHQSVTSNHRITEQNVGGTGAARITRTCK